LTTPHFYAERRGGLQTTEKLISFQKPAADRKKGKNWCNFRRTENLTTIQSHENTTVRPQKILNAIQKRVIFFNF
jgi:hypothetical protein